MNRMVRPVLLFMWLGLGLVLIVSPWLSFWESNFFLNRFPPLIKFLLNPYLRGAISGLGVLDAVLAADAFRRPAGSSPRRAKLTA